MQSSQWFGAELPREVHRSFSARDRVCLHNQSACKLGHTVWHWLQIMHSYEMAEPEWWVTGTCIGNQCISM